MMNNFEIKPREILFSTIIVAVMVGIGVWLQNVILRTAYEDMIEVASSAKISKPDEFSYIKRTNAGRFIAEGVIAATSPVTIPDIHGEYTIIEKVKERYTAHTRITHTHVNGHTVSHVQTYHTWDVVDREKIKSDSLIFLDQIFLMDSIKFDVGLKYSNTINESSTIRYKYYTCADSINGAMTGVCKNKLYSDVVFKEKKSIDIIIKSAENRVTISKVMFWVLWIILILSLVCLFYYAENDWLEDKK